MAQNKLRELILGRTKWFLLMLGVIISYILALVATIIFVDDVAIKVIMIIYEVPIILLGILAFVLSINKNQ